MRLNVVFLLTKINLKRIFKKPASLFWSIVFPIFMITLTVYVFIPSPTTTPMKTVKVLLISESPNLVNATKLFVRIMNNITIRGVHVFNATYKNITLNEAINLLRNGTYDAIILIPKDFVDKLRKYELHVEVYYLTGTPNRLSEQLVYYSISNFLYESAKYISISAFLYVIHEIRAYNLTLPENPEFTYVIYHAEKIAYNNTAIKMHAVMPKKEMNPKLIRRYVAGIMAMAMIFVEFLFIGILGTGLGIVEKFEKRYIERLFSTKLSPWEFFTSLILSTIIEGLFVTVLCLIYAKFGLNAIFAINPLSIEALFIAVLTLSAIILTSSIGIIIGTLFRSSEAVNTIANIIIWPTMFLGGIWIPYWMLPKPIRWFAKSNILSQMLNAIVAIMSYGKPVINYVSTLITSIVASIGLLVIATLLYKRYLTAFLTR